MAVAPPYQEREIPFSLADQGSLVLVGLLGGALASRAL